MIDEVVLFGKIYGQMEFKDIRCLEEIKKRISKELEKRLIYSDKLTKEIANEIDVSFAKEKMQRLNKVSFEIPFSKFIKNMNVVTPWNSSILIDFENESHEDKDLEEIAKFAVKNYINIISKNIFDSESDFLYGEINKK